MKVDRIMDENKLTYIFTIYRKIIIKLDHFSYTPKNGVPQGGINPPILFNFAMYYFFTEAAEKIKRRIQESCGFPVAGNDPRKEFPMGGLPSFPHSSSPQQSQKMDQDLFRSSS